MPAEGARADAPLWADLKDGGPGVVISVIDGDTVKLASGVTVRLVGIEAPKLPFGRPGFGKSRLADSARENLIELLINQPVRLFFDQRKFDRYGRKLAHVWRTDPKGIPQLWVQGEILEAGLARVATFPESRTLARQMLSRETVAREKVVGMWADSFYEIRVPEDLGRLIDTYQVVAGRVVSIAVVRGRGYINYGDDWHDDFTASIAPKVLRKFPELSAALAGYEGNKIQVRGWIKRFNGPMIDITHPEQIELIADPAEDTIEDTGEHEDSEWGFENAIEE